MKKWEHDHTNISVLNLVELGKVLDRYGDDGWELVAVTDGRAYFKREKVVQTKRRVCRKG